MFASKIQIIHISSKKVSYPARFSHHNSLSDSSVTDMRTEGNTATSPAQIKNNTCVLIYGNSSSLKQSSYYVFLNLFIIMFWCFYYVLLLFIDFYGVFLLIL